MLCIWNQVSVSIGANRVIERFSFEIKPHDKIGLVGRNGSGKTTIFNTIAGIEQPESGDMFVRKGTTIGYLRQIPDEEPGTTVRDVLMRAFGPLRTMQAELGELEAAMASGRDAENMERLLTKYGELQDRFASSGGYAMDAELMKVATGLGLRTWLDRETGSLSGGEQTKVGLALILLQKPDLLLLDEPTNHLDVESIEWLEDYLRQYDGAVMAVSHDRYFLDEIASRIIDIEDGELGCYEGNYSSFLKQKEEKLLAEFAAYQEQQKKIKQMEAAIKRLREWGHIGGNEKFYRKAASMQKALERMNTIKKPVLEHRPMALELEAADRSGKDVVRFAGVTHAFGARRLLNEAELSLRFGERIAIVGRNGSGKSTILKLILGQLAPNRGKVLVGESVKIGYVSQHFEPKEPGMTLIDAFRDAVPCHEGEARQRLAKFLFYGKRVFAQAAELSGGETMRLRLAQLMYQDINLLVLDEPTNHLDIDSREVLEDTLERFEGTVLCVSHDRYFLRKLFPTTYWLEDGALTRYEGDYDYAKRKREETAALRMPEPSSAKADPRRTSGRPKRTEAAASSMDANQAERRILEIERRLAEVEAEMLLTNDPQTLMSLQHTVDAVREERDRLYEMLDQLL